MIIQDQFDRKAIEIEDVDSRFPDLKEISAGIVEVTHNSPENHGYNKYRALVNVCSNIYMGHSAIIDGYLEATVNFDAERSKMFYDQFLATKVDPRYLGILRSLYITRCPWIPFKYPIDNIDLVQMSIDVDVLRKRNNKERYSANKMYLEHQEAADRYLTLKVRSEIEGWGCTDERWKEFDSIRNQLTEHMGCDTLNWIVYYFKEDPEYMSFSFTFEYICDSATHNLIEM